MSQAILTVESENAPVTQPADGYTRENFRGQNQMKYDTLLDNADVSKAKDVCYRYRLRNSQLADRFFWNSVAEIETHSGIKFDNKIQIENFFSGDEEFASTRAYELKILFSPIFSEDRFLLSSSCVYLTANYLKNKMINFKFRDEDKMKASNDSQKTAV
jgi:hypothetical protein